MPTSILHLLERENSSEHRKPGHEYAHAARISSGYYLLIRSHVGHLGQSLAQIATGGSIKVSQTPGQREIAVPLGHRAHSSPLSWQPISPIIALGFIKTQCSSSSVRKWYEGRVLRWSSNDRESHPRKGYTYRNE